MSRACPCQEKNPISDEELCKRLQFPSIECLIMRKRTIHALSLMHQPFAPLAALLLRPLDESCHPWCDVLCDGLRKVAAHYPSELGHPGDPESDPVLWHEFVLNESGALLRLVRGMTDFTSELASVAVPTELDGLLRCPDCS